jgi:hypothetical protein
MLLDTGNACTSPLNRDGSEIKVWESAADLLPAASNRTLAVAGKSQERRVVRANVELLSCEPISFTSIAWIGN